MLRPGWLTLVSCLLVPSIGAGRDSAADQAHVLQAASGSSPRPSECRTGGPDRAYTFWDRARDPRLSKYCNLLAKGYARLESDAAQALEAARRAGSLEPARSAPRLLEARALVAQGRMAEAFRTFQEVLTQAKAPELGSTARSGDLAPAGLYDYAVAAVGSGQVEQGLAAYRRVVPMASLLTGPGATERVYVEAAVLVMRQGPAQLPEAVAYLNEARRQNTDLALRPFVLSALALALDRQGRHEEARGVARDTHGHSALLMDAAAREVGETPRALPGTEVLPGTGALPADTPAASKPVSEQARVPLPRIDPVELLAMAAMLAAIEDAELAREYWKEFVERAPADHPWLTHARAKLGRG